VAGTLSDYKEAERVPAELTAALTNIHDDAAAFKQAFPDLDLERLEDNLVRIVGAFRHDLGDDRSTQALDAIDELNVSFLEFDRIGVPATYTSRLRAEQGALRRSVLRVYHVPADGVPPLRLPPDPVDRRDHHHRARVHGDRADLRGRHHPGFISFFFISLLWLLRIMDRPFHIEERTDDDVSLFLLRSFVDRLNGSAT
jgi:hypothetical protein